MADNALALLEGQKARILEILPAAITPDRWWALALQVSSHPELMRCTRESLVQAVCQIAAWGLNLDGEEAVIIAYGNVATAQAMWRGMVRRAIEGGAAKHIYPELLCEGEPFRALSGTQRIIEHQLGFGKRGKIIGAYAIVKLPDDTPDYELFDLEDIEHVKASSMRITGGKLSPAWSNYPGEMIKKSVIKRLCKRLRGRRDTDEGQRYTRMIADIEHNDPEPTPALTAEEMPRAAEAAGKGGDAPEVVAGKQGAAVIPPKVEVPTGGRVRSALVDDEQLKLIDENSETTRIATKLYSQLMREFGIKDEHELAADKLPQFLERMHELAING